MTDSQPPRWRHKLHEIIFEADTRAGKAFDVGLIIAILLSVLGFPVLSAFLLGKALFKRQVKKARAQEEVRAPGDGEYIEFEELEDEPLELPRIPKQEKPREQPKKKDSHYDEFFE